MINFNEAYEPTGDQKLVIELMKIETEQVKAAALKNLIGEIKRYGIRVRVI
ncbi:hypothetical protein KZA77_001900 [Streptococcus constellatus]|uniref:hypothetical protein n=1 Tax=Streptococcus constellatus TaxID=76860 RepID=UPI001C59B16F|nr:hypothetical protein [Streptococcus constellatus]MBW3452039.1 hypothetical protein [Streptococcus constellatus]